MNVYRGKSGQLWFELGRDNKRIILRPEYHGGRGTDGGAQTILTLHDFKYVCDFELVGTSEDGEKVNYF